MGLVCGVSTLQASQPYSFASESVENIYNRIPRNLDDAAVDSICFFRIKTRVVNSQIQDIGVAIDDFQIESPEIHSFVERKVLELLLSESVEEVKLALCRSRCELLYNGDDYVVGSPWNLQKGIDLFRNFDKVSFNNDLSKFYFKIEKGGETLELIFPLNIQVVSDKNKMELELEFRDVLCYDYDIDIYSHQQPERRKSKLGDLYTTSNNYLFLDAVNDVTYYQYEDSQYTPVFSPKYEVESFTNMFHFANKHTRNVNLNITHLLYGNKINEYDVSLERLLAYCKAHKLNVYVGIEEKSNDMIKSCILIQDESLKYLHILYVRSKISELFGGYISGVDNKCEMLVDLYTYVPTDNIGNIFDDDNYKKRYNKFDF